jgi:hypothetical protein
MKEWTLDDARRCLGEVVRRAERCGPQRVGGPDGNAVVLSEADFKRILADAGLREDELRGPDELSEGEPESFAEFMRRSPLAEAFRTGEITPEEWDLACRIGR